MLSLFLLSSRFFLRKFMAFQLVLTKWKLLIKIRMGEERPGACKGRGGGFRACVLREQAWSIEGLGL